jgi:hypothetical protein
LAKIAVNCDHNIDPARVSNSLPILYQLQFTTANVFFSPRQPRQPRRREAEDSEAGGAERLGEAAGVERASERRPGIDFTKLVFGRKVYGQTFSLELWLKLRSKAVDKYLCDCYGLKNLI